MQNNRNQLPTVTVIVLNYNGLPHLQSCFDSLRQVEYPRDKLEIMFVDNGSSDGSEDFVRQYYPEFTTVQNGTNLGFAEGNNVGARRARGEILAFLNNDTRVDPNWLIELVRPMLDDEEIVCTAAKILDWGGKTIDFVEGGMNFHGFAYQKAWRMPVEPGQYKKTQPLLFACGGSMAIRRQVFLEVGGFDKDFFVFYEDVDLGWRLWVLGYKVVLAPKAITYHRHHSTASRVSFYRRTFLYERNALYAIIKNYEEANLNKILPAALFLAVHRATDAINATGRLDLAAYQPQNWITLSHKKLNKQIPLTTVIPLLAVRDVIDNISSLMEKRAKIQANRRRSDYEIVQLFDQPLKTFTMIYHLDSSYAVAQTNLINTLGLNQIFSGIGKKVLILTSAGLPRHGFLPSAEALRAEALGQGLNQYGHYVTYSMPKALLDGRDLPATVHDIAWDPLKIDSLVLRLIPDILIVTDWEALKYLKKGAYRPIIFDGTFLNEDPTAPDPEIFEKRRQALEKVDLFICLWDKQCQILPKLGLNVPWENIKPIAGTLSDKTLPSVNSKAVSQEIRLASILEESPSAQDLELLVRISTCLHEVGETSLDLLVIGEAAQASPLENLNHCTTVVYDNFNTLTEALDQAAAYVALPSQVPTLQTRRELWQIFALSRGLPWLGFTRNSPLVNIVQKESAGWVITPGDDSSLRETLLTCLFDQENRRRYRQNALRATNEYFSLNKSIASLNMFCYNPQFAGVKPVYPPPTPLLKLPLRAWEVLSKLGLKSLFKEIGQYLQWRYDTVVVKKRIKSH